MIRSADSAEKEEATHRLRTNLIVMGHEHPINSPQNLKTIRRQTFHAHISLKQATSQWLGLQCISIQPPRRGRHKQLIQVGPLKQQHEVT